MAVVIPLNWNESHWGQGSSRGPSMQAFAFDVADDLAALKPTTAASADATDLASAITLVNELKGIVNTVAAITIGVTKGTTAT